MKTKSIIIAIFAICFLTNCSKNDTPVNDGTLKAVHFLSHIDALKTRTTGGGDRWSADDRIGIYMINHGETLAAGTIAESADNREYKSAAENVETTGFNPVAPEQAIYYPKDENKVDFISYYPYRHDITGYKYPVNVADQGNQAEIDLLYASSNNNGEGYDKSAGAVNLTFGHPLSKLAIKVEQGGGLASLDDLKVTIKGMKTIADFDLATGALSNEGNAADILPNKTGDGSYEAILLPVAATDDEHYVEFEADGNIYKWQLNSGDNPITGLEAGKKYTYTITITKTGIEGASGTITPWDEITGTGEASTSEQKLNTNQWVEYALPGDNSEGFKDTQWGTYLPLKNLWDGIKLHSDGDGRFENLGGDFPQSYTIDLGANQELKLSRIIIYSLANYKVNTYGNYNPKVIEVYVSNDPATDGSWESWTKLAECVSVKPSGSPIGTVTDSDFEYIRKGESFKLTITQESYRYIRLKVIETWGGVSPHVVRLDEIELWGISK